jgi:hypothetical protein
LNPSSDATRGAFGSYDWSEVVLRVLRFPMLAVDALSIADVPTVPLVGNHRVFSGTEEPIVQDCPLRETNRDCVPHHDQTRCDPSRRHGIRQGNRNNIAQSHFEDSHATAHPGILKSIVTILETCDIDDSSRSIASSFDTRLSNDWPSNKLHGRHYRA